MALDHERPLTPNSRVNPDDHKPSRVLGEDGSQYFFSTNHMAQDEGDFRVTYWNCHDKFGKVDLSECVVTWERKKT